MTDLAVRYRNDIGASDLCVVGADLAADNTLETAIIVSLFSDARVRDDELPEGHTWRRGFWGSQLDDEPDNFGSKLWTLRRSKATQENLVKARAFCREALRWMIRDGVAIEVDVQTSYPRPGRTQILIGVVEPDRTRREFQFVDVVGGG